MKTSDLNFATHEKLPKILIITGPCRVGKTTLGTYLARNTGIEFLDEPWVPLVLPQILLSSTPVTNIAHSFFYAYFKELCNEMVLLRRANFRPNDASSIWKTKNLSHILSRMIDLKTRADVHHYINEQDTIFIFSLPEITPFVPFFFEALPTLRIIHMSRSCNEVALEIEKKKWFSDEQLRLPKNSQPFRLYTKEVNYYMPWWLEAYDYDLFLEMPDLERGMLYWEYFIAMAQRLFEDKDKYDNKLMNVNFEYFINNKEKASKEIINFCSLPINDDSETEKKTLKKDLLFDLTNLPPSRMTSIRKLNLAYENFGK